MIDYLQPTLGGPHDVSPTDRLTRCFASVRADLLKFLTRRTGRAGAEDILHDAWINLRERGNSETWKEPRAVLFATAANLATDAHRRSLLEQRVATSGEWYGHSGTTSASPEAQLEATRDLERLEAALASLPGECREAFLLNRLEALTHAQIASRLGVSTKSVQRYIERALRQCIEALRS